MNPANSGQALAQLQNTEKTAQDPNTIQAAQNKAMGVDSAQQTVTGLRGAIDNTTKLLSQVAPGVMGRTANSLVTNAQANRQIQNEQAPISANLTKEGTDYNNANSDLTNLEGKAQTAANGIYQGQQDKLSYAQNLYNTMFGREQAASQAAEQKREFNANLAESRAARAAASSGDSGLAGLLGGYGGGAVAGGGGGSSSQGAQAQARKGGGYNFQDAKGQTINFVQYAKSKGINANSGKNSVRSALQQMANSGDKGAKAALNYVGNDLGVNVAKLNALKASPYSAGTYNNTVSLLKSLGFNVPAQKKAGPSILSRINKFANYGQ